MKTNIKFKYKKRESQKNENYNIENDIRYIILILSFFEIIFNIIFQFMYLNFKKNKIKLFH